MGIELSIIGGTSYDSVDSPTDEAAEVVGDAVIEGEGMLKGWAGGFGCWFGGPKIGVPGT